MKCCYSFKRFNRSREFIRDCWCSRRKITFANIEVSLRNTNLFGKGWSKSPMDIREI